MMSDTFFKKEASRSPKIALKIAVFLIIAIFFVPSSKVGASTKNIGFEVSEGYATGTINGQQGWTGGNFSPLYPTPVVSTDYAKSGNQSLLLYPFGWAQKEFEISNRVGSLEVFFFNYFPRVRFKNSLNEDLFEFTYTGEFNTSTWNYLKIDWDLLAKKWRWTINDKIFDWENISFTGEMNIKKLFFYSYDGDIYIDDLIYNSVGLITPVLEPEKPVNCQKTIVNYSSVEVKGKITIPNDNPYTYRKLYAHFQEVSKNIFLTSVEFDLPDLKANDIFNYYATTSLPETAGYKVYYWLEGYDEAGKRITTTYDCETYVAESYPIIVEGITIVGGYEELPLENCDILTGSEYWLCKIKNLFQGLFIPSTTTTGELRENVEVLKEKFPVNYLVFFRNFFSDIKNGVNETSDIKFKVLGQAGIVNFSFWENEATIGGITQKFYHLISNFLTIFVIFIFMMWGISFLKRIFR